jgi:hypothetical protein
MVMMPISVEFIVKNGDKSHKEDSVTFGNPEELFAYIAPGGGCERMPSDLGEIQMIFLPPKHPNITNPIADKRVTLQLGIVLITGPLSTIVQTSQEIIDKVGRAEVSEAFLAVIGANY